ncbi:uncharacterized protein LOC105845061 [Hydra vulgaris]|uniref:uncharacterized protein LOC105845061 n=1 Tax=Hydra vulgaris TaxID=6087 RepID=UPI001F5E5CBB|nr:uncharacterized protein LOC105845061 [Hydra vulgaris]
MHTFLLIVSCAIFNVFSSKEYSLCEENQKKLSVNHKCPDNCTEKSQQIYCSTISAALSLKNLTNTCIVIEDNQILNNVNVIKNVSNLTVTGINSEIVINCTSNLNAGILIYNVTKLLFMNLHIKQCGSISKQTFGRNVIILSSALFFSYIVDLTFINVYFTNSNGYSVVLLDGKGNITFEAVIFQNNTFYLYMNESSEYYSGGGLLIWYSQAKVNEIANINIENCTFRWNSGKINAKIKSLLNESDVPFGHGGGLGVFFTEDTSKNILSINNCKFLHNKALQGGGLFVFQGCSNSILIKESLFIDNNATQYGGGSCISEVNSKQLNKEYVTFENCTFFSNSGIFGGALSFKTDLNKNGRFDTIKNCNFSNNSALLGSAVHLHQVSLVIDESKFSHNSYWQFEQTTGQGAVYAYGNEIQFLRENLFENSSNTAVILENAVAFFSGQLYFKENKGTRGGALGLYSNSRIIINSNSSLASFINNSALQGGAIYAEQSVSCPIYKCFKHEENKNCFFLKKFPSAKLEYSNNKANYDINDIFVPTLSCCHFNDFGTNNYLTDPVRFKVFEENFTNIYPGKKINPTVLLVDEFNHSVSGSIDVYLNGSLQSFIVKENKINMQVFGKRNEPYFIIFSLKNFYQYSFKFNLTTCPLGYELETDRCICNKKNLVKGIICNNDGGISLFFGLYVDYNQSAINTDNETTHICPYGYCTPCPNLTCSFGPDKQCANGRLGFLCSECPGNKTVEFGGEGCVDKCKWLHLIYILLGIFIIFFLVCFAVAFLNICIYDLWLNSWIYFYQVVQYHITASMDLEDTFINTFLRNILNFHGVHLGKFSANFCLMKEWNDLDKLFFNYLIPLTMFLSIILIAKWNKLYQLLQGLNNKVINFMKNCILKNKSDEELNSKRETNCIRIYLLISVLAYGDITRITLSILLPVEYNGLKNRVYFYGEQQFFSGRHLIYGIIAILVFFLIVLLWPLLLITTMWWTKWKIFEKSGRLHPIFSAFHGPFHDHFQWFASFYFFSRVVIYALGIFINDKLNQLCYITMVSLIVFIVFGIFFPYKKASSNYFDTFVLFLLVLIGALSNGRFGLPIGKFNAFLFSVTKVLMYLPCLIVFRWFYCLLVLINLKGWYENRKRPYTILVN